MTENWAQTLCLEMNLGTWPNPDSLDEWYRSAALSSDGPGSVAQNVVQD